MNRDIYQELRTIGLTSDQCCDVMDLIRKLPITVLVPDVKATIDINGLITIDKDE